MKMVNKKLLFLIFPFLFFISCKNKSEIIFWEYNENLNAENVNKYTQIQSLKSSYNILLEIPFEEFEYFDSVKKIFKFKNDKTALNYYDKLIKVYKNELIPYYCFSVVSNGKVIMHGLSRPFPHGVEIYENDSQKVLKLVFDVNNNLRFVMDQDLQVSGYGVEIIDTDEIEKLIPDCRHETPEGVKIIKDDKYYYIILDDKETVITLELQNDKLNSFILDSKPSEINANILEVNNGDYRFTVNLPGYHEFSYVCKPDKDDDTAFFNDIKWNDKNELRLKMLQNGKIEERE
ncbi:MAG: hypothetical protein IK002_08940 [Treponema sp.]|uniref:hypothetical protein n=1 Tax=Treponema sp. TaxID=166 RepID=UPI00298D8BA8|nr:hypothetical protein [Treponema sp.]MBR5934096.1 hypothetical protein [Treponema sp.]